MLLTISCWIFNICHEICYFVFSSTCLAREDWDFLELPDDLLSPDSVFLEDTFDDLLSVLALLNQLWIFLLQVQNLLSKSSNLSSSSALFSLSRTWLYSSWMLSNILNRSLNWPSSSSTAILFLFQKRSSSIMLHFLIILTWIFSLLSFNNVAFYALPFSVAFLLLVETSFTSFSGSPAGNRTSVSRVRDGDTYHSTRDWYINWKIWWTW